MSNQPHPFTAADLESPTYCVGCQTHIPKTLADQGRGLCPACLAKINGPAAAPPVTAPPLAPPPPPPRQTYVAPPAPAVKPKKKIPTWGWVLSGLFVIWAIGKLGGPPKDKGRDSSSITSSASSTPRAVAVPKPRAGLVGKWKLVGSSEMKGKTKTGIPAYILWESTEFTDDGREITRYRHERSADVQEAETKYKFSKNKLTRVAMLLTTTWDVSLKGDRLEIRGGKSFERYQRVGDDWEQQADAQIAAQQEARVKSEEAKRGPMPIPSEWDGITPEVNAYLKENLKDPDSLKIVNCSTVARYGKDGWAQSVKYRAKNSFGGYNLTEQIFIIKQGRVANVLGG